MNEVLIGVGIDLLVTMLALRYSLQNVVPRARRNNPERVAKAEGVIGAGPTRILGAVVLAMIWPLWLPALLRKKANRRR